MRGSNGAYSTLHWISVTPSATHNQIGPLWCWFPSGWACACPRPLWVSPTTSPVRLGVSPAATPTPTGVFNQRFEALFPSARVLGYLVCFAPLPFLPVYLCVNVGLQGLPPTTLWGLLAAAWPAHSTIRHLAGSSSHSLAMSPLRPGCLSSLPLLLVWMNVSSLSPWSSDFHIVRFSVSSRFLFLSCCCPPFGCARRHSVST